MLRWYILRRVLLLIPTLLLVTFLVFSIVRLLPGDVVAIMIAEQGYADDEAELRKTLGLDKPVVIQYVRYMKNVFKGDLGKSLWSGKPVSGRTRQTSAHHPSTVDLWPCSGPSLWGYPSGSCLLSTRTAGPITCCAARP